MLISHTDIDVGRKWQSRATFVVDKETGGLLLLVKSQTVEKDKCESVEQNYIWDPETESFMLIGIPVDFPKHSGLRECQKRPKILGPVDFT